MAPSLLLLLPALLMALSVRSLASAPPMAPAFIWSDQRSFGSEIQGAVDYRVFSPQSLFETLLGKFGWSHLLCSDSEDEGRVEMLLAFFGSQLRSVDISRDADVDLDLLRTLKESFSSSNYSVALPYVALPAERPAMATTLLSTIQDSCDLQSRHGKTVVVGACFRQMLDSKWLGVTEGITVVDSAEDIQEFMDMRRASRTNRETDIMLVCPASTFEPKVTQSEGEMLGKVLLALRQSGTTHTVLYTSDPFEASSRYTFRGRLLTSNSSSNDSSCDEICETIAGFYEGLIVAITLLIILISGLCCMMGIDTPTRFETAQDS